MLQDSRNSLSIFLRPKSIVYKLFSHRYLLVAVIVASFQMVLQLWLEGRSLAIHRQGVDLLIEILETRNQPLHVSEPSSHGATSAGRQSRRSLQYQVLASQSTLVFTSPSLVRRGEEKNGYPALSPPAIPSPKPSTPPNPNSPSPPNPPPSQPPASSTKPNLAPSEPKPSSELPKPYQSPVHSPPPPNPQPPASAPAGGRDTQKVKDEVEVNKRRKEKKPPSKSSQTRLENVQQDPSALNILQEANLQQGGNAGSIQTTDMAAPGAAIFVLDGNLINLSAKCVTALKQPMKFISRSHRTDIARIVFHVWLWGLTIWSLLLESIPHLAAVVISQYISAAFVSLDLKKSINLKEDFASVVNNDCDGVDVLPEFWGVLLKLDIVAATFASAIALTFTFLAFKLYSILDWRTFKKLGASRMVRIAHTLSLIFAAILQLNAYFVTVFLALWLREVLTYQWGTNSKNLFKTMGFKVTLGFFLALSAPWLLVGNFSLKHENLIGIIAFLIFDVALLTFTIFLLSQGFYRQMADLSAICKAYFSALDHLNFTGIMACILMFASLLVAVACLLVFDRGLLAKVNRDSKSSSDTFERPSMTDDEIAFPNNDVTPYNHQSNGFIFTSYDKNDNGSVISQPQAVLAPRLETLAPPRNLRSMELYPNQVAGSHDTKTNQRYTSSSDQSWIAGDEKSWMSHNAQITRSVSGYSEYSASSSGLSYATTTFSQRPLSPGPAIIPRKP
ncbi:hypothetical protein PSTT_10927 [Puccinia striiformis]|uniref:Uncharacterized protein n=1 Tax=Puccinia striiformis TaxID=27350 RepID=A0A2S4V2C2_9BASI|nr:hypothetical protein PSTT_10927 [Puccinia striiformis]